MANMSYCRFENTSGDLQDCLEALQEDKLTKDSSRSEIRAAEDIYEIAREYIREYEDWLYRDNEDEDDGELEGDEE